MMKRTLTGLSVIAVAAFASAGIANADVTSQAGSESDSMSSNSSYAGTSNDDVDSMASDLQGSGITTENGSYAQAERTTKFVLIRVPVLDPVTGEEIGWKYEGAWVPNTPDRELTFFHP